jgi:hypothetical protein
MMGFVQKLRDLCGGLPVEFKLCMGKPHEFAAIYENDKKT